MLVIPLETLTRLACSVEAYTSSPRFVEGKGLVYPDGWTNEEMQRLVRDNPQHLLWLARHKLVPVGWGTAVAAIEAHKKKG